ncbi:hypothetical protein [Alkalicoccus luteus]|uniref:Uncharacterized protein n=1 Tax=Alkalicoccus luteus TaxID=1237094 RepID=A0A969PZ00_9BACI|nr:hypothetical protein [Alkalicoccus luteus]NJP38147.1 hypothetical protein [Alkalicoccus luteus]
MLQTVMLSVVLIGQVLLLILFIRNEQPELPLKAKNAEADVAIEQKRLVELQLLAMHNACSRQREKLHVREIQVTNPKLPFPLSEVPLTAQQSHAAKECYRLYADYLLTYWKTDQGEWKTAFRGHPDAPDTEAGGVRSASIKLEAKMQDHLRIWYDEERNGFK